MKENLKIKLSNEKECGEVQDLFFDLGCYWFRDDCSKLNSSFDMVFCTNGFLTHCDTDDRYFNNHVNKEITLSELRELARLKEYLNDKFELVVTNQPDDGWILVPEGAEIYTSSFSIRLFWSDNDYHFNDREEWQKGFNSFTRYCEQQSSVKILWQRKENKVETTKGRFLHQEWYEAFGRGEDLEYIFNTNPNDVWEIVNCDNVLLNIFNDSKASFRLKPQTIQIGSRTIVKPISVKPEIGTRFYLADIAMQDKYNTFVWDDSEADSMLLGRGICHLTKEDAIMHTELLISLTEA